MKVRSWIVASIAVFALAVSGSLAAQRITQNPAQNLAQKNDKPAGAAVTIDNFTFAPASMTVKAGTTVRWTNHDDIPHTVVADDLTFKSKALDTDDAFSYTFSKPGTYSYFCSLHPKMKGQIVVQ